MHHELLLISSFVYKERQDRYKNLIATSKGRKKFRTYIAHFKDLDSKNYTLINNCQSYLQLYHLLKSNGAPDTCYLISEHSDYDMKNLHLLQATENLFNSGISYFISCIPGKLIYYEGEELHQKILLSK
jgi:hypothetical protein